MPLLLLAIVAVLALTGCVAHGSLFRHPGTQETRVCANHGWGVSAAVAGGQVADCEGDAVSKGYSRVRRLTMQEVHCLGWKPNPDGTCSKERLTE